MSLTGNDLVDQLDAGADCVVIHASLPEEVEPFLTTDERLLPASKLVGRTGRAEALC